MSNLHDAPDLPCCHDLMLATPGKLFSAKGWIYELKHDGFRVLVSKQRSTVRLESRNGNDMSDRYPELVEEIRPVRHEFVADGELVMLDHEGRSIWERLHSRHRLKDPRRIARAAAEDPAVIFAFDLLWLDGADLRQRPLLQRKDALYRMLPANRRIRYAKLTAAELDRKAAGRRSKPPCPMPWGKWTPTDLRRR